MASEQDTWPLVISIRTGTLAAVRVVPQRIVVAAELWPQPAATAAVAAVAATSAASRIGALSRVGVLVRDQRGCMGDLPSGPSSCRLRPSDPNPARPSGRSRVAALFSFA